MMRAILACAAVLLAGCLSQPHTPEPALYDLGFAQGGGAVPARASAEPSVARVRVSAPSWLDHTSMHYRLLYVDEMRTLAYAYARWIAPPAELVGQRLRQTLAESGAAARRGSASVHEIAVELEEYVQVFETPTRSFGRVSVEVRLFGPSTGEARFTEQAAAQTPDAAGGVRALAAATDVLITRIVAWVGASEDQEADTQVARPVVK